MAATVADEALAVAELGKVVNLAAMAEDGKD